MRSRRARPVVLDGALALVVIAVELLGAWASSRRAGEPSLTAVAVAWLVARGAALVFARTHPYLAGAGVGLATAVYGVGEFPDPEVPIAPAVALFAVLLASTRRVAIVLTGVVIAGAVAATAAAGDSDAADYYVALLTPALAWAVAELERNRRARVEESAERGAAEERARIARELHDVVAHHVGVMVVQAEAGASLVPPADERVVGAFDSIAGTGRAALAELRRLLAGWRDDNDTTATEPQPELARLDALVAAVRDAGLPVEVAIEGDARPLAPGVDLSAYRIVQEALTNVMKHAGPARASVLLRYHGGAIDIVVRDDGRGPAAGGNGVGHGLTGIRERVALFGGEVRAGPAAGGGYEVVARLPYDG